MPLPETPTTGRRRRVPKLLRVGLLMLAAVALALVAFEGVLAWLEVGERGDDAWRTGGYHAPDEELIYFPIPGATKVYQTAEFTENVTINSIGLRDDEVVDRSEVDYRILVLGDSMTFGHGVQQDETFPNVLESLYRQRDPGRRVDVINAGIKGYGFDQYHGVFFRRLRQLDPDLVVMAFYVNDVTDNILHPLYRIEDDRLVLAEPSEDPLYRIGRFNETLPGFVSDTRVARWLVHQLVGATTQPPDGGLATHEREQRRKLRLIVEDFARAGAEDGFDFMILGVPHRDGPPTPYPWLRQIAQGRAQLLDLSADRSWQEQKDRWFFGVDYHLNVAGNRRVATELFEFLRQHGR